MSVQNRLRARFGLDNNNQTLVNVANPSSAQDAMTLKWIQDNVKAGVGTSLPTGVAAGQFYYLTAISGQNQIGLYYYTGSAWTRVASSTYVDNAAASATSFSYGTNITGAQTSMYYLTATQGSYTPGLYYLDLTNGWVELVSDNKGLPTVTVEPSSTMLANAVGGWTKIGTWNFGGYGATEAKTLKLKLTGSTYSSFGFGYTSQGTTSAFTTFEEAEINLIINSAVGLGSAGIGFTANQTLSLNVETKSAYYAYTTFCQQVKAVYNVPYNNSPTSVDIYALDILVTDGTSYCKPLLIEQHSAGTSFVSTFTSATDPGVDSTTVASGINSVSNNSHMMLQNGLKIGTTSNYNLSSTNIHYNYSLEVDCTNYPVHFYCGPNEATVEAFIIENAGNSNSLRIANPIGTNFTVNRYGNISSGFYGVNDSIGLLLANEKTYGNGWYRGIEINDRLFGNADLEYRGYQLFTSIADGTGANTIPKWIGYGSSGYGYTNTANHATITTTQHFYANQDLTAAPQTANNVYGFYSDIIKGSQTNVYNFYAANSAPNYFGGDTTFNTALIVNGTTTATGSVTLGGGFFENKTVMPANAIDLSTGTLFQKTISGATTFTITNVPATGKLASFILELTNGGSAAITWWAAIKWAGGTAPTLTTSGKDILSFYTHDGGTTWNGIVSAKDVK